MQSAVSHATSPATAAAAQAQQDAEANPAPLGAAEAAAAARAAGEPGSAYGAPQVPKRNTTKPKPKPKPGVAAKKKRPKPADTPATKAANEAKKLYPASDFGGAHSALHSSTVMAVMYGREHAGWPQWPVWHAGRSHVLFTLSTKQPL